MVIACFIKEHETLSKRILKHSFMDLRPRVNNQFALSFFSFLFVFVGETKRVSVQCASEWVEETVLVGPVKIEPDRKTTCQISFNKVVLTFSTQRLPHPPCK